MSCGRKHLVSWVPAWWFSDSLRPNMWLQLNLIEILVDVLIISGIKSHMRKWIALSSKQHLNNIWYLRPRAIQLMMKKEQHIKKMFVKWEPFILCTKWGKALLRRKNMTVNLIVYHNMYSHFWIKFICSTATIMTKNPH